MRLAMPVLLENDGWRMPEGRQHCLDVHARAGKKHSDRVRNGGTQIRPADYRGQGHEVRCHENHLRSDSIPYEEALKYLLTSACRMHCYVSQVEKLLDREPFARDRVIGAQQAGEAVGEETLLEEVRRFEVREIAHGEIDFAPLEAVAQLRRSECDRAHRSERRHTSQSLQDLR